MNTMLVVEQCPTHSLQKHKVLAVRGMSTMWPKAQSRHTLDMVLGKCQTVDVIVGSGYDRSRHAILSSLYPP